MRIADPLFFVVAAAIFGGAPAFGAESLPEGATASAGGLYWQPHDFGSEAQFNPLTAAFNLSLDILRNPSYEDRLSDLSFGTGMINVFRNISQPTEEISHFGWKHFIAHEVFPIRGIGREYGQFIPNWFIHTLGEGMVYRKLQDWYAHYHVRYPRLLAITTTIALQLLNESFENGSFRGPNQDPIADVLIWNPLGLVLFSFEPIARFFRGPVLLNVWLGQPALGSGWRITNGAESYAFKVPLGLPRGGSVFVYLGKEALLGGTISLNPHDHLSLGGGASLNRLQVVRVGDGTAQMLVPDGGLVGEVGIFWDRDESLLMSFIAGLTVQPAVELNVYPGLVQWSGWALGGFARWSQGEGPSAGLTLRGWPLGLGWIGQTVDHPDAVLH